MLGELVAGAAEGLVLVEDTVDCEGRSLLQSFVAAAACRGECVHVFGFEVSEEEFRGCLDPRAAPHRVQYHDSFHDPLGWSGVGLEALGAQESWFQGLRGTPGGAVTVVVDSLSWILLRQPSPAVCQALAGARVQRMLVLLHADLHPPGLLGVLRSLARVVVALASTSQGLGVGRGSLHLASVFQRMRAGKVVTKKEYYTLQPGFPPMSVEEPRGPMSPPRDDDTMAHPGTWLTFDPRAQLTFNPGVSVEQRQVRDAMPLPFHFSPCKKLSVLDQGGQIYYEPDPGDDLDDEDPDDDLDV
ncbi:elongator complex protein 5 isoform C [Alligator mississippiensis]|uniref:Elongator complex protein 5 n=1 Tax=Alligator mississippiensis TaxID=8496 RepID=A0A151NXW9_ALLMI|nr:elongator complex protein 5 isoform C [Alligator mississippiensis]